MKRIWRKSLLLTLVSAIGVVGAGCMGPPRVELSETIEPYETAFLVPLESAMDEQEQFDSVSYLEKRKVTKKRVIFNQRKKKIGRYSWQYKWILTESLIKVSRKPVTREWTENANTGTSNKNQVIVVQTQDKIKIILGVMIQAYIDEPNTAKYLYYYKEPLHSVIDSNVRGWVQQYLAEEFARVTLDEAGEAFPKIFDKVFEKVNAKAQEQGITVVSLGNVSGFDYVNPEIKKAMELTFTAKQDKKTAEAEQAAAKIRNQTKKETLLTEAEAAQQRLINKKALEFQTELEIKRMKAQADLQKAKRWDGQLPTIVAGQGSMFLDVNPAMLNNRNR